MENSFCWKNSFCVGFNFQVCILFDIFRKSGLLVHALNETTSKMNFFVIFFFALFAPVFSVRSCGPCNCYKKTRTIVCEDLNTKELMDFIKFYTVDWVEEMFLRRHEDPVDLSIFDKTSFPVLRVIHLVGKMFIDFSSE